MDNQDSQKSEVHDTTDDASTSPASVQPMKRAVSDAATSSDLSVKAKRSDDSDLSATAHIVRDDTDNGGPLVIEDPTIQVQGSAGA